MICHFPRFFIAAAYSLLATCHQLTNVVKAKQPWQTSEPHGNIMQFENEAESLLEDVERWKNTAERLEVETKQLQAGMWEAQALEDGQNEQGGYKSLAKKGHRGFAHGGLSKKSMDEFNTIDNSEGNMNSKSIMNNPDNPMDVPYLPPEEPETKESRLQQPYEEIPGFTGVGIPDDSLQLGFPQQDYAPLMGMAPPQQGYPSPMGVAPPLGDYAPFTAAAPPQVDPFSQGYPPPMGVAPPPGGSAPFMGVEPPQVAPPQQGYPPPMGVAPPQQDFAPFVGVAPPQQGRAPHTHLDAHSRKILMKLFAENEGLKKVLSDEKVEILSLENNLKTLTESLTEIKGSTAKIAPSSSSTDYLRSLTVKKIELQETANTMATRSEELRDAIARTLGEKKDMQERLQTLEELVAGQYGSFSGNDGADYMKANAVGSMTKKEILVNMPSQCKATIAALKKKMDALTEESKKLIVEKLELQRQVSQLQGHKNN